jgi:2-oxo-hept-3-ene-1,7-dioate hydratase
MQASSQINEPDYGHLLDYMMIADGAQVPHSNYCVPRVEVELAFILGKPLKGPGIGLTDVLHATEYVIPAMEIVDARIVNPRKIFDTVADNAPRPASSAAARPARWKWICWVKGIMYLTEIEETASSRGRVRPSGPGRRPACKPAGENGVTLKPDTGSRGCLASYSPTRRHPAWGLGPLGGIAVQFI